MGKEACQRTRRASGHSKKNLALEIFFLVSISENQIQCLILEIKPGFKGSVLKIRPNFELVPGNSIEPVVNF